MAETCKGKNKYMKVSKVEGPIVVIETEVPLKYGEIVEIEVDGEKRKAQVLDTYEDKAVALVFERTTGITEGTPVKATGSVLEIGVSQDYLGGIYNGFGEPIFGEKPVPEEYLPITGTAINPASRKYPREPIITGISEIDVLHTILRGQKIAIFSGSGLPHHKLAVQIARQAHVLGSEEGFAVVFAAIGVPFEIAQFFIEEFRKVGLDSAKSILELEAEDLIKRTDLEEGTVMDVLKILKEEFED